MARETDSTLLDPIPLLDEAIDGRAEVSEAEVRQMYADALVRSKALCVHEADADETFFIPGLARLSDPIEYFTRQGTRARLFLGLTKRIPAYLPDVSAETLGYNIEVLVESPDGQELSSVLRLSPFAVVETPEGKQNRRNSCRGAESFSIILQAFGEEGSN